MDIVPVSILTRIVEPSRHSDHEQQRQRRQPPRKKDKVLPAPVYTPDGHMEEPPGSKIDVVA